MHTYLCIDDMIYLSAKPYMYMCMSNTTLKYKYFDRSWNTDRFKKREKCNHHRESNDLQGVPK